MRALIFDPGRHAGGHRLRHVFAWQKALDEVGIAHRRLADPHGASA